MKYEVIETEGQWIVQGEGVELARFDEQTEALNDVADRLRAAQPSEKSVSLRVCYQSPDK